MACTDIINQSLCPNSTKDTIKYLVYRNSSTYEDIKNNHILEEFRNLVNTIYDTRNKKIKDFVNIYQIAIDYSYKISDLILLRHFLLETVEEINNDLIRNNKPYRVDFGDEMFNHFVDENESYLKRKEFYDDDGTFNDFKLEEPEEIETDLPVLYL